jgi:hypothetical protein
LAQGDFIRQRISVLPPEMRTAFSIFVFVYQRALADKLYHSKRGKNLAGIFVLLLT